jgi:hypothetical protein
MIRRVLVLKLIKEFLLMSLSKKGYKGVFCYLFSFHSMYYLLILNYLKNILDFVFVYVGYFVSSKTKIVRYRLYTDNIVELLFFLRTGKHFYPKERGHPAQIINNKIMIKISSKSLCACKFLSVSNGVK